MRKWQNVICFGIVIGIAYIVGKGKIGDEELKKYLFLPVGWERGISKGRKPGMNI
jgi:hypothetical protein